MAISRLVPQDLRHDVRNAGWTCPLPIVTPSREVVLDPKPRGSIREDEDGIDEVPCWQRDARQEPKPGEAQAKLELHIASAIEKSCYELILEQTCNQLIAGTRNLWKEHSKER